MIDAADFLDLEDERDGSFMLGLLTRDIDFPSFADIPSRQEIRDCKLLCTLTKVTGLTRSGSWMSESTPYEATLRILEDEKVFRLVQNPSKRGTLLARMSNPEAASWESFDYFGQSRMTCSIRKKGWLSSREVVSFHMSFQEIMARQLKHQVSDLGGNWHFEESVMVELAKPKPKGPTLQSKLMALKQSETTRTDSDRPKRPIVTVTLQFRLVFLKSCLQLPATPRGTGNTLMTDFHVLCASAPSPVLADMMKALAAKGILSRALAITTPDGLNALEVALVHGHSSAVNTLLQRAGRLCFQPVRTRRRCVMHHAVQGRSEASFDLVRRFLKKYGSQSRTTEGYLHLPTLMEWRDDQDHTPLTLACSQTPTNHVVDVLLIAGADIGSANSINGYTALMYASAAGNHSMVSALLAVVRSDTEILANISGTEVHWEDALSRHIRFNTRSRRLVLGRSGQPHDLGVTNYSCQPLHRDVQGRQALHIAAIHGHEGICSLLIRIGAPIVTTDHQGCNVFHMLAEVGRAEVTKALVRTERARWERYLREHRPNGLETMVSALQPLLALNNLSLSPAQVALLNGHNDLASYILDEAVEIYGWTHISDHQRGRIEETRGRIEHMKQFSDVYEHKESEGKEKAEEQQAQQQLLSNALSSAEAKESATDEEVADQLDYHFALSTWTSQLLDSLA